MGAHPHFSGQTEFRLGLLERRQDKKDPLDGSFYGWGDVTDEDPGRGSYPILIDVPDFQWAVRRVAVPSIVTIQVSAFARWIRWYESEDALYALRETGINLGSRMVIPYGTFALADQPPGPGTAEAEFTGVVKGSEVLTNPLTAARFVHLEVETLGGDVDVVADPVLVEGSIPTAL
jgi:hypothetical protein